MKTETITPKLDTINKFFNQLKKTKRKFTFYDKSPMVRTAGKHQYCVVNAVAKDLGGNKENHTGEATDSAEFLGLGQDVMLELVESSDTPGYGSRYRLLKTVGLYEKAVALEEKQILKYLKVNKLDDTPKNRKAARETIVRYV